MAKVTNLNQFRKARARAEDRARAEENAVKFGRTKAQKAVEEADRARARRVLEAHVRDEAQEPTRDAGEDGEKDRVKDGEKDGAKDGAP